VIRKITEAEKRSREKLFRLMRENPDLPVVPMVDSEVVADDSYSYWMGYWGNAELSGYILTDDRVLFRGLSDDEEVLDALGEYAGWEDWPDEKVDEAVKNFPWIECIVVYITT